ncbi:MAG: hypothetical protein JW993_05765 [Sedimentisphaerales bacterium]|nr:hypothetical protein [Sedimentisphaerales bacterium]
MADNKQRIEELLEAFADRGVEKPRWGLLQEIKSHIPARLSVHRLDTINIIVDLRISRLAAAAAIIVVVFLAGIFFGGREAVSGGIYEDSKSLINYALGQGKAGRAQIPEVLAAYRDSLLAQGKEVVYYGDKAKVDDPHAILMHWRLDDDQYGVIFGDFSAQTVSGKTLIRLQAYMIREQRR